MLRAFVTLLTALQVLAVSVDLGQVLRVRPAPPAAFCCCGPHGVENGCTCTGPCCAHGPVRDPASGPWLDDHCGARTSAPAAPGSLLPGTPVAVVLPDAPAAAPRTARDAERAAPVRARAPGEPPPEPAGR